MQHDSHDGKSGKGSDDTEKKEFSGIPSSASAGLKTGVSLLGITQRGILHTSMPRLVGGTPPGKMETQPPQKSFAHKKGQGNGNGSGNASSHRPRREKKTREVFGEAPTPKNTIAKKFTESLKGAKNPAKKQSDPTQHPSVWDYNPEDDRTPLPPPPKRLFNPVVIGIE